MDLSSYQQKLGFDLKSTIKAKQYPRVFYAKELGNGLSNMSFDEEESEDEYGYDLLI